MSTKPTYHLDQLTLGPDFSSHTPDTFLAHIEGMKDLKSMSKEKKIRVPRVKKLILPHSVESESGLCTHCSKKPRNAGAKCPVRNKIVADAKISACTNSADSVMPILA